MPREEKNEKKLLSMTAKAPVDILREVKKQRTAAKMSGLNRVFQAQLVANPARLFEEQEGFVSGVRMEMPKRQGEPAAKEESALQGRRRTDFGMPYESQALQK